MSGSNTDHEHNYNNLEPMARKGDEEESTIQREAPDGGLQAWLVAAGAGCAFFAGLGFANSFGVFQEYYMAHQLRHKSPDDIAWIGSLNAFLQFVGGAVGGPLADRFGATVIIRPAAMIYVFSIMMISLCKEYWQFMLAQGVLTGLSMGLVMFPAIAAVSQYFDRKRAAALGIAISGSSIGGVVFPIVISKMLNSSSLGFGWSVRIVAFTMMPFLIFACIVVRSRLPPRATTFFIGSAFKQPNYNLLITSIFFMFLGMFTPLFFMPTYAVMRGMDAALASYLVAVLNGASTFGRIIPGILADKFGRLNMMAAAGIVNGIVIFCMNSAKSTAALVVYSVVFGFTSGMIISGAAAAFSICQANPRHLGTYMGMGMAVGSLAALIGPPVNGALVAKHGSFFEASMFSGAMCLTGGLVAIVCKGATPQGIRGRI